LQILNTTIFLQKWTTQKGHVLDRAFVNIPLNTISKVKIRVEGNNIKVFINNSFIPLINYTDNDNPILNGKIALAVIAGNSPSEVWFDNVVVKTLEEGRDPLIFIPGLGGSWNHKEIFLGIDQPQSNWHKTPFIKNYEALIQSLQNAGYVLNKDLFIFYYDWLQPVSQSADDLKNYINNVVQPAPDTKIDIVGHSLGGLVARTYLQNNLSSHKVDQLITVGSPHKGVPQVYRVWEGVELNHLSDPKERIAAGILLRLHGFGYSNLVEAVRHFIPSLKDLLFIDDYLVWSKNESIKPETTMFQQNNWLKNLGINSELLNHTTTIAGTNKDTPRWLKIVPRTQLDKYLGKWEDGKPIGEVFASGDKTVLEESAQIAGANIINLDNFNHGEIIETKTGIKTILELLGFPNTEVVEQTLSSFEPALVFTIASPANLRIIDPLGRKVGIGVSPSQIPQAIFIPEEKLIIIPQPKQGNYRVEIIGENSGGFYQLIIGQLTNKEDIWIKYEDKINSGQTKTYTIPFNNQPQAQANYLLELINSKLKKLRLQIKKENLSWKIKFKLISQVLKILTKTRPLAIFIKLENNQRGLKQLEKATSQTINTIHFTDKFSPDLSPKLREILDLMNQLQQIFTN